jgi:NAD(P)-dependent dehydrogenase (short-subunit alcohol dehydrogenase family)
MSYQNFLDKFLLKDKVIIVTGGTGVLGESFVNALADAGAIVIILGRNEAKATERVNDIFSRGGKAFFVKADVLSEASLQTACKIIINNYGKIDGLVNAAGGNVPESVIQPTSVLAEDFEDLCRFLHAAQKTKGVKLAEIKEISGDSVQEVSLGIEEMTSALLKAKQLLDSGVISQEEFDEMKKSLLKN